MRHVGSEHQGDGGLAGGDIRQPVPELPRLLQGVPLSCCAITVLETDPVIAPASSSCGRVPGATVELFLALAAYVAVDATHALYTRTAPDESIVGIVLATLSLGVMPLLARAKERVARALGSGALVAEARQTIFCTYLSAILLAGLLLNAAVGWWWADPIAALVMVPIIAKEGLEGIRGRSACADCCP
jgi:cation efflux family protein